MERMKKWFSKWILALMATAIVLVSLVGCSTSEVNDALDVVIEVLEAVEELEATVETANREEEDDSSLYLSGLSEQAGQMELATVAEATVLELEDTEEQSENKEENFAEAEIKTEVKTEQQGESQVVSETEQNEDNEVAIDEDGHYTSKEEVALYIYTYGKLPSNFISKKEAESLGWKKKQGEAGQLHVAAPGMSIGGSPFGNYQGLLPEKKGRKYYECDINYVKGNRGAERIVYSNDGLIFYTGDHYESFEQLYPEP